MRSAVVSYNEVPGDVHVQYKIVEMTRGQKKRNIRWPINPINLTKRTLSAHWLMPTKSCLILQKDAGTNINEILIKKMQVQCEYVCIANANRYHSCYDKVQVHQCL